MLLKMRMVLKLKGNKSSLLLKNNLLHKNNLQLNSKRLNLLGIMMTSMTRSSSS